MLVILTLLLSLQRGLVLFCLVPAPGLVAPTPPVPLPDPTVARRKHTATCFSHMFPAHVCAAHVDVVALGLG
jgi:hypothetical protein